MNAARVEFDSRFSADDPNIAPEMGLKRRGFRLRWQAL
jgi:hypothetical protein